VHHLTFCTALCPGYWNRTKAARVIGPVAAPLVPESYLPLFGARRWTQSLRNHVVRRFLCLPWLRKSFAGAAAVFPANSDMKNLLNKMGINCEPVMLDTGAPVPPSNQQSTINIHQSSISGNAEACRFLYAGVLERRKGIELALRAFAKALEGTAAPPMRFGILGKGPDRRRLESLAADLGIANRVDFMGVVPQAEVARHFAEADVFVFTSVRDASGGVNLEAMAAGLPILCLAHQGVADITDESCAIRVPPGEIGETIDRLATGMQRLAGDPVLRRRLGECARTRAVEAFSWEEKFVRMVGIYESVG
jgi:glycosyltransferase involved in cell wall biosynthesis